MNKEAYHKLGRKKLKALATKLNLNPLDYEIRSYMGGSAVDGEIVLHHEKIYIMIHKNWSTNEPRIMYRACKGRKDYSGGSNNYMLFDHLLSNSATETFNKIINNYAT